MHKLFTSTLLLAGLSTTPLLAQMKGMHSGSMNGAMSTMWGPVVGLNFATFGGSSASGAGFSSKTGLTVGLELQRDLAQSLFLRIGALYSMRGADQTNGNASLNYIEIPAMLGYTFKMQGSRTRPYVMAGGQFGIKASCSVSGGGSSTDCNTALGTNVSSTDIGVTGGAGVMFPAGRHGHALVEARYLIGLTNLISSAGAGNDLKNKGFTVEVGYMMPFGH
ncbi:MAG TPA: porin family protein [Gemmatimonadales bacterium]